MSDSNYVTSIEMEGMDRIIGYVVGDFKRVEQQQRYQRDPALWAWHMLGVSLHDKQIQTCFSIIDNKNTAVTAGHGTGKSFLAALLACWWVDTHPIGDAYVATTAPSADQISEIIFREIKRLHGMTHARHEEYLRLRKLGQDTGDLPDHALPGRIGEDNAWKVERVGRLTTVAKGRKPPDNKAEDAFQGLHARYVLAIGDEATGLTEEMIDGLANITSNDNSRRLLISNPTNPRSHLGNIFLHPTGSWNLIYVSVFDLPTFHGGGKCTCPEHKDQPWGLGFSEEALGSMSGPSFVEDKKRDYGEDSARYKARVLGQWAFEAGSNLYDDLDLASARDTIVEPNMDYQPVLGVDIARFGEDDTYVYKMERGFVMERDTLETFKVKGVKTNSEGSPVEGFRARKVDSWSDAPLVDRTIIDKNGNETVIRGTATRVHEWAMSLGASEVRVDASGLGGGVIDALWDMSRGSYTVIEIWGGAIPPDRREHINNRAFQFDRLKMLMHKNRLDLDGTDENLFDQLGGVLYDFGDAASGGGMKIESKEAMKRRKVKSPDAVDALWMAVADLSHLLEGPLAGLLPGDEFHAPVDDFIPAEREAWLNSLW